MASASQSTLAPLRIERVALAVRDVERMSDFYRSVLGLENVASTDDGLRLGAGGHGFLELQRRPNARMVPASAAGLFHTAFLLPSRADLGRWLHHAFALGVQLEGASDHGVSEAVYLSDPEGNGIEIYVDRPVALWPRESGELRMTTERLAIETVLAAAGSTVWDGVPEGTSIGHVHLRVGDLAAATRFYRDVIGLDLMVQLPSASFLSSGGYHHHIAVNVWHSRGSGYRSNDEAGLAEVELHARDRATVENAFERALEAGSGPVHADAGFRVADPSGNRIRIARDD